MFAECCHHVLTGKKPNQGHKDAGNARIGTQGPFLSPKLAFREPGITPQEKKKRLNACNNLRRRLKMLRDYKAKYARRRR